MRPNYTLARLFLDRPLAGEITLDREPSHYLATVLRKRLGDNIRLFNARDGEVRAEITAIERKAVTLAVRESLRDPATVPDIRLLFAPLRKHRTATVLEKATELGARTIQPVITARTQYPKLNLVRAQAQIVEAAEQTERLDLPRLCEPVPLADALDQDRALIFADEAGEAPTAIDALTSLTTPLDLLVGPEGGFTPEERTTIRARPNAYPVSLGPRILRADTAAISLLTLAQAQCGDWRD